MTPFGFPAATAMTSVPWAIVVGGSTSWAATSRCIDASSAVATTSAGAPSVSWVTSCWDPAKL